MGARGGLYWAIREKTSPVEDRVKLLRYAWKNSDVFIPNKEQTLLDWLCLTLAGKFRVTGQEAECVWRCLRDVLLSTRCRSAKAGQPLVLKNTLYQVLLKELDSPSVSDDIIISCCHAIVTSSNLGHQFTSKYEYMVQLAPIMLQKTRSVLSVGKTPAPECHNLLLASLDKLAVAQNSKVNHQQVAQQFANKVFLPGVCAVHSIKSPTSSLKEERKEWADIEERFNHVLKTAFFPKDLQEHYTLFLKLKTKDTASQSRPAKFVEAIFAQITTAARNKVAQQRDAMLSYLPQFYDAFINCYKGPNASKFKLLMHLGNLLLLNQPPSAPPDQLLHCVERLLQSAALADVHSRASDTGGKEILWLKKLVQLLLDQPNRSLSFFGCLQHLLNINHHSLETALPTVLTTTCLTAPQLSGEALRCQESFLCEVIFTYNKLRQIPKLYDKMMQGISELPAKFEESVWPSGFENRLADAVTNLPQTTIVNLWRKLLTSLKQGTNETDKTANACKLTAHFLLNIKVADYSLTHQVAAQVAELMEETALTLKTLINSIFEQGKDLSSNYACSILHLLWSWGELHLLLKVYTGYTPLQGSLGVVTSALHHTNLSYVFPLVSAEECLRLFRILEKFEQRKLGYLLGRLVVQKARAVSKLGDDNDPHVSTSLRNCVTYLCSLTSDLTLNEASWDGRVQTLSSHNYSLAVWSLVCDNIQYVLAFGDQDSVMATTDQITKILAGSELQETGESTVTRSSGLDSEVVTLRTATERTVCGHFVEESDRLHGQLLVSVWQEVSRILQTKKSPKRQKQQRKDTVSSGDIFETYLSDLEKDLDQNTVDKAKKLLKIDLTSRTLTLTQQNKVVSLLKILHMLPAHHFLPSNQSRCILGLVTLLAVAKPDQTSLEQSKLVQTCFNLLSQVLFTSRGGYSTAVDDIGTAAILKWMRRFECCEDMVLSKDAYRGVQTLLLKQALREKDSVKQLDGYISLIIQAGSGTKESIGEVGNLDTLVACLNFFGKVLLRTYVKEEIAQMCCGCYDTLQAAFLLNLKTRIDSGKYIGARGCSTLDGFACLLNIAHKTKNEKAMRDLAENFDVMCELCLEQMKELINEKDFKVESRLNICLRFTKTVCYVTGALDEKNCTEFFLAVWKRLVTVLQVQKQLEEGGDAVISQNIEGGTSESELTNQVEGSAVTDQSDASTKSSGSFCSQSGTRTAFTEELLDATHQTLSLVISCLDTEDFGNVVQQMLDTVEVDSLETNHTKLLVALDIWQNVLQAELNADNFSILSEKCETMVFKLQQILSECTWREQLLPDVVASATATVVAMLTQGPTLLTSQCAALCLHSCYHGNQFLQRRVSVDAFVKIFNQMYQILNQLLVQHTSAVFGFVPSFMSATRHVLRAIVQQGQQRQDNPASDREADQLASCAHLIERLFSLLITHKKEFSKVVAYTVADYINEAQKVTLLPKVKKSLLPGIHKLLEICDEHSTAQLHTTLSGPSKEIFKSIYEDYLKFFKYTGKI